MYKDIIGHLRDYCQSLDPKTCHQLHVTEFGNMLLVIEDKGLLDGYENRQSLFEEVTSVYEALDQCLSQKPSVRIKKSYLRKYNHLIVRVKKDFGIAPYGNIEKESLGLGMALGSGVGVALMAATGPVMLSIGICIGITVGLVSGKKREKAADEEGKLF